jgi:autophagy-related protein 18
MLKTSTNTSCFRIRNTLRLLIASSDGYLYLYALNLEEGGDCSLIKQFQVAGNSPQAAKDHAPDSSSSDAATGSPASSNGKSSSCNDVMSNDQ